MENMYANNSPKTRKNKSKTIKLLDINSNPRFIQKIKKVSSIFLYSLISFLEIYILKYNISYELFVLGIIIKGTALITIISQIQLMICLYMVINEVKNGFMIAVLLNILSITYDCIEIFIFGNSHAIPNIILSLCTVIIIKIINLYRKDLKQVIIDMQSQNEKFCENVVKQNYIEFYDVLTNLPNRKMIINRIDYLINCSIKEKNGFAVVLIDLNNFKKINNTIGHLSGDLLLREVAEKLNAQIDQNDILGYIRGDEFALIVQRNLKEKVLLQYVENIRRLFFEMFTINNMSLNLSASFGVSIFPRDGNNSCELLKYAGIAMNKAKDYGRNNIKIFDKSMNEEILSKYEFESNLCSSIQKNELFLVFQPQYSSKTKNLRGFEVLARWKSMKLGFLQPAEFIPIAEETGYIVAMGEWILRATCNKLRYIQDTFDVDVVMSVNISAVQIMEPNFLNMVREIIEETGINSRNLEFEVTESVFISSIEYVAGILRDLKEMGIGIALDDFGTGYSSLNYLQMLPINMLKIDKSFIDMIEKSRPQRHIVGSIISLVHKMGIEVVAEGVENEIQIEYLRKHSCDYIQCFLWGKPLDSESLFRMLEEYKKIGIYK